MANQGSGIYDVDATILPKQGMTPHEVLAKRDEERRADKKLKRASEEKSREAALSRANATMEKLNAENWSKDAAYFDNEREKITTSYAEMLQKTGGSPSQEDLLKFNEHAAKYQINSKHSMQFKDDSDKYEAIIKDETKYEMYTPESIEAVSQWFELPFSEKINPDNPKPQLEYVPKIADWTSTVDNWLSKSVSPLVAKYGSRGGKNVFDDETWEASTLRTIGLGFENELGEFPDENWKQVNAGILKTQEARDELNGINDPTLRREKETELILEHLRDLAYGKYPEGDLSYRDPNAGKGNGDDPEKPYDPGPVTPVTKVVGGKTFTSDDTYNININEGVKGAETVSVDGNIWDDKGVRKTGGLVDLSKGAVIYEDEDGKDVIEFTRSVESTKAGKTTVTHPVRLAEITPALHKQLMHSSEDYRKRAEWKAAGGKAGQAPPTNELD